MKRISLFLILLLLATALFAQNRQGEPAQGAKAIKDCKGTIQDYDGNSYAIVQIGEQCWMKENLRSTHYSDGTAIPLGKTASTATAYRYEPNGHSDNVKLYGYLYNWPAVHHNAPTDKNSYLQGVCPQGWHIPYFTEWYQLSVYTLDNTPVMHTANSNYANMGFITMGLSSKEHWNIQTSGANQNYTDFSAIPAGCLYNGNYFHIGAYAYFWSVFEGELSPNYISIPGGLMDPEGETPTKDFGISVRCLRNE